MEGLAWWAVLRVLDGLGLDRMELLREFDGCQLELIGGRVS